MSHPEIEKTIGELKAWCSKERGRSTAVAKELGVSKQLVSYWLLRKTDPMTQKFFEIRDFLRKQKH